MPGFELHPGLVADTSFVSELALSRVLLMNDRRFPWLILVPRRESLSEVFDLDEEARTRLMHEIVEVARKLKSWAHGDKINVAAFGNQVPQLHVHVIARKQGDAAWPNPVWGVGKPVSYEDIERTRVTAALKTALSR